ncbi:MAG: cohesin domain-containing protein, partial [Anaerolineae bacterium]
RPATSSYTGSTRNGVTSHNWTEPNPSQNVAYAFSTGGAAGTPTSASGCDWTGLWKVGNQTFSFSQTGAQVSGTGISDTTWRLTGTVAGNVLTGKWSDHTGSGSIRIVLSGDCNPFDSAWGAGDAITPFTGHGVRASCDWAGDWKVGDQTFSFSQTGAQVSGTGVSDTTWRLTGTVAGNVLTGKWSDHTGSGSIRIVISGDCNSFDSAWGAGDAITPFTGHGVRASNTSGMTLEAPYRLALPNDLVLIAIKLNNAANVANLNFDLHYDAGIVRLEGKLVKGDLLDNALFSANSAQSGLIRNGFAQTSGLSGTGTVVNIPFRVVGKPGDKSPLNLNVTTINDPGGGVLTIGQIPGEIRITNPDGTLPGGGGGIPHGDCDGDLKLTEVDALCALEMSTGIRASRLIMDIDASGDVTSRDAVVILQRAVGK